MTLPVVFDAGAAEELAAIAAWYELRREGLGARYLIEVGAILALASAQPGIGAPVPRPRGARRLLVPSFPYAIRYVISPVELRVLVIAHTARRPTP